MTTFVIPAELSLNIVILGAQFQRPNLMGLTWSPNGSKRKSILLAGFRLRKRICFTIALNKPPEREIVPLKGIDILNNDARMQSQTT
jgi:hypothetical protein